MAGIYGRARSNDIIPNGKIVNLPALSLPGTLTLATYGTYGNAASLKVLGTGTFSVDTAALATTGVAHAAGAEVYLPVNGQNLLYFNGSGSLAMTLYTSVANEA